MNRRKLTLLSVAAAVLMAGILLGSVWLTYFTRMNADFTLPPPLPPGPMPGASVSGPDFSGSSYVPVTVDAKNIQALLLTVERPEAYSQTVECIYYWPGGEEPVTHQFSRRGGVTRVETRHGDEAAQNRIITASSVYVWTGDARPHHRVAPEDTGAEDLSGIRTWESVAAFPADDILYAEYIGVPGGRSLLVRTREAVYQGEYIVSLETGLLDSAVFTDTDGQLAYEIKAGPPVIGDPGDAVFMLPDGQIVVE